MVPKSTPTLRRVKRQKLYERSSTTNLLSTQNATSATLVACEGDTESVHSQNVEAPTSGYFHLDGSQVTFDDRYPSILVLIRSLAEGARRGGDCAVFCDVARRFITNVFDIATCVVTATNYADPTKADFILAKHNFYLLLKTFVSEVGNHRYHTGRHRQQKMRSAFTYATLLHESLSLLYGLMKGLQNNTLPPLQLSPPPTSYFPVADSTVVQRSDHFETEDNIADRPGGDPFVGGTCFPGQSSGALQVDNYNLRHTILFFGEEGMSSTSDEGSNAHKSHNGDKIRAISVSSLFSIIAPEEGSADPSLTQVILANFRFFLTANEFFNKIKRRFELTSLPDPTNMDAKISNIRSNVLAVIYSWLDQHWQADTDVIALGNMRNFVQEQTENDHDGKFATLLCKIKAREQYLEEDVLDERRRLIASTSPASMPPPDSTKFIFPRNFHKSSSGLLQLDRSEGREELSRHLTMKMSELYQRLDPTKAVRFWYNWGESSRDYNKFKEEPGVNQLAAISAYGERLTFWIITSIVEIDGRKGRVKRISLWTDVACRCMEHRDYATAYNIYASLNFSAVSRLKKTILMVPHSTKAQYNKLDDFFKNDQMFRETFNDLRPSLPSSTAPLIKDILHSKISNGEPPSTVENATSEKLIFFDEFRVLHQATRVLNKALMEYKFHKNDRLSQWLDDRLEEFCSSDRKGIEERIHEISGRREPSQPALRRLSNPWHYSSFKSRNLSKGNFSRLIFGARKSNKKSGEAEGSFASLEVLAFA